MATRRGDSSVSSLALLHRHVAWIDGHLDSSYGSATTLEARREFACAGLANSDSWMGWLRGGTFWPGMDRFRVMEPEMASAYDLPSRAMKSFARDQDKTHVGCRSCHGVHQQRWTVCWEMAPSSPGLYAFGRISEDTNSGTCS
jgi:hypothetical protein